AERDEFQPRDENNHFAPYDYVIRDVPLADVASLPRDQFVQRRRRRLKTYIGNKKEPTKEEQIPTPPSPNAPPERSEITFDQFWKAIVGDAGEPGPAQAAWTKLTKDDRQKIFNLIGPQGLSLDGMWACTWLKAKRWKSAPLSVGSSD